MRIGPIAIAIARVHALQMVWVREDAEKGI